MVNAKDDNYANRVNVHWSTAARLEPNCFVMPSTAEVVSLAVTTLVKANEHSTCKFAVRSGGHTLNPGAANIGDGVTIDLGKINAVTYHVDNETASIEPGSRLGDVYETLDALGVSTTRGRATTVSTAGIVLGGRQFIFYRAHWIRLRQLSQCTDMSIKRPMSPSSQAKLHRSSLRMAALSPPTRKVTPISSRR